MVKLKPNFCMSKFISDETYNGIDFTVQKLDLATYEDCVFTNCTFTGQHLSGFNFVECTFENCDLSNAQLGNTSFREVTFKGCKMLGLHFEHCNDLIFSAHFIDSQLDFSCFYQRNLKNSSFNNCSLKEVDFGEANMSGTILKKCNLADAAFDYTNLEKADLRQSFNFNIDPETNRIQKAKFSASTLAGLLGKYNLEID